MMTKRGEYLQVYDCFTTFTCRDFTWFPLTPIDTAMQRYDPYAMGYITGIWNVNTVKR